MARRTLPPSVYEEIVARVVDGDAEPLKQGEAGANARIAALYHELATLWNLVGTLAPPAAATDSKRSSSNE